MMMMMVKMITDCFSSRFIDLSRAIVGNAQWFKRNRKCPLLDPVCHLSHLKMLHCWKTTSHWHCCYMIRHLFSGLCWPERLCPYSQKEMGRRCQCGVSRRRPRSLNFPSHIRIIMQHAFINDRWDGGCYVYVSLHNRPILQSSNCPIFQSSNRLKNIKRPANGLPKQLWNRLGLTHPEAGEDFPVYLFILTILSGFRLGNVDGQTSMMADAFKAAFLARLIGGEPCRPTHRRQVNKLSIWLLHHITVASFENDTCHPSSIIHTG